MADDRKSPTGSEENIQPEPPAPEAPGIPPTPDPVVGEAVKAEEPPSLLDVIIEEVKAPLERPLVESKVENQKPQQGRPPKTEKTEPVVSEAEVEPKAAKPRKGRPAKVDKAAPDGAQQSKRDKVSQSEQAAAAEEPPAPAPGQAPVESGPPPRPIEEGELVYLKLSELHPFHTFRDHPYKVQDDDKMTELVGTIKEHGVMTPATVRPEKDGSGYEIIAGHRRHRGSELAGAEEMPCIVRNMSDYEAVREMRNSNKQRGDPLPSELARLLDLEVEAIKHQGGRMEGVAAGDVGKRSVEIVGADPRLFPTRSISRLTV